MAILKRFPKPITYEETNIILEQMKNCICLVKNSKEVFSTGFFCSIPYKNKKLQVLITVSFVIDKEEIKKDSLTVSLNNGKEKKIIKLNDGRKIYINEKFYTTIIEIKPEIDKINSFLDLEDNIFQKENSYFENQNIYVIQYPNVNKMSVSYGIVSAFEKKYYQMKHYCSTDICSGGSPIINLSSNKVIGIHFGSDTRRNFNIGTFLQYPINEYLIQLKSYKNEDFTNLKLRSSENFGDLYNAYSTQDEEEVFIKKINKEKIKIIYEQNYFQNYMNDLNNEIEIIKNLSFHPNSLKFYGNYEKGNEIILILEKCDENLKKFMEKRGIALKVEEIKEKFIKLNNLFEIIQTENIVHINLKMSNFFIKYLDKEKHNYVIKLGEYGIGKFRNINEKIITNGLIGSFESLAPEIILDKFNIYNPKVDIFSLGIILYQLSHNMELPFSSNYVDYITIYKENYEQDKLDIKFDGEIIDDNFKNLLRGMLKLNPKNRMNWEDYFNHPFFKKKII